MRVTLQEELDQLEAALQEEGSLVFSCSSSSWKCRTTGKTGSISRIYL